MYSIIRLCIVLAAVFVQATLSNADIFSEGGDPSPSIPDSQIVVKNCKGCKANADTRTCTKGGVAAKCKYLPFQLFAGGATQTVLPGTCAQVAGCGTTNKGCKANDQWIIYLRYPDNKDDGTKVTWEV